MLLQGKMFLELNQNTPGKNWFSIIQTIIILIFFSCKYNLLLLFINNINIPNRSLGLIVAPKLRFLQKIKDSLINDTDVNMQIDKKKESEAVQLLKNINSSVDNDSSEDISDNCFSVKSNHNSGSHFKHCKYLNYLFMFIYSDFYKSKNCTSSF